MELILDEAVEYMTAGVTLSICALLSLTSCCFNVSFLNTTEFPFLSGCFTISFLEKLGFCVLSVTLRLLRALLYNFCCWVNKRACCEKKSRLQYYLNEMSEYLK